MLYIYRNKTCMLFQSLPIMPKDHLRISHNSYGLEANIGLQVFQLSVWLLCQKSKSNRIRPQIKVHYGICTNGLFCFHSKTISHNRDILEKCKQSEQILLIQCEDADENNELIVCAAYCVQDEKKQAEQTAANANIALKPAHIVLVNQLPRVHRQFQGFQGTPF